MAKGYHLAAALLVRARVATAEGASETGGRDAYDALACVASKGMYLYLPGIFECLACLATTDGSYPLAARLFGAADAFRQRMGLVRFQIHDAACDASLAILRNVMDDAAFDAAWAEGAALGIEEAIAYAQRGRGERKRPTSGWPSLTPAERDVARLICEGLANKEIAARLFVSPRTVQAHLSHTYAKLGITSRVQLMQEPTRNSVLRIGPARRMGMARGTGDGGRAGGDAGNASAVEADKATSAAGDERQEKAPAGIPREPPRARG